MDDTTAQKAIRNMAAWMYRYYGKNVIILLDEYDTPMQEAYLQGYWDEYTSFIRSCLMRHLRQILIWNEPL